MKQNGANKLGSDFDETGNASARFSAIIESDSARSHCPELKSSTAAVEPFYTVPQAAVILNVKTWALARAVSSGAVPSHTLFNSRRLVRINEIEAAMNRCAMGDVHG